MQRGLKQIQPTQRQGAALLVALVCVSIAVAVMAGIVRLAIQAHREVSLEQRRTQARWILESAVDRATSQLARDGEYRGEHWSISAGELGSRDNAEVRIQVERVDGQADWREVHIIANHPVDLPYRVRQTRVFRMQVRP